MRELARHHIGGQLKVAPEHSRPRGAAADEEAGDRGLRGVRPAVSRGVAQQAGKQQYLVPYFIAGHPGCDLEAMIDLALFLKRTGYRPAQVQDFIPGPMDIATCMYYTGLDPMTGEPVYVPARRAGAAAAAGPAAILQAGELRRRARGPRSRPAAPT